MKGALRHPSTLHRTSSKPCPDTRCCRDLSFLDCPSSMRRIHLRANRRNLSKSEIYAVSYRNFRRSHASSRLHDIQCYPCFLLPAHSGTGADFTPNRPARIHLRQRPRHLRRHRPPGTLCRSTTDLREATAKTNFRLCEREDRRGFGEAPIKEHGSDAEGHWTHCRHLARRQL